MSGWITKIGRIGTVFALLQPIQAGANADDSQAPRALTASQIQSANTPLATTSSPVIRALQIRHCEKYPYAETPDRKSGEDVLREDVRAGLQIGLQCLAGHGPMGALHPYHVTQAERLAALLASPQTKTLQCVEDAMFATAVATSPKGTRVDDPLYNVLHEVDYPAVVLDTFRLGGILSRRYDDQTYRAFFHLRDDQIYEHHNGQPLRPANLHRYENRPALLFHEMVHWLGHEHTAIYPDVTQLYETCCFGGSDYINNPERNREHQQTACSILKDDDLWRVHDQPYRQMRIWHHKGYNQLKTEMRNDYDS